MRTRARSHNFFDTRSVLLFAALSLGAGVALHARAADKAPTFGPGPLTQPAPPAAENPANRPPAMAHKNTPPPMTTSPAFGPAAKAAGTGGAQNPDVRPEMAATMPSAKSKSAFDKADANKDGQLSANEVKAMPGLAKRFQKLDTNHDGMLSRDEFNAGQRS